MSKLAFFEAVTRRISAGAALDETPAAVPQGVKLHPFDERNIHPEIAKVARKLFDNGHYAQATFEAFKFVDKQVSKLSQIKDSGYKLMMAAFSETSPKIRLNELKETSDTDEQRGFQYMFAGATTAIRNIRGHEVEVADSVDECLDHLSLASFLLRRLDNRVGP